MLLWGYRYGKWWSIQWSLDRVFSLGFHFDMRRRITNSGEKYGPYLDIHLPCLIISLGVNPIYSGAIDLLFSYSRGGIDGNINNSC
jgi:hypothetical protein